MAAVLTARADGVPATWLGRHVNVVLPTDDVASGYLSDTQPLSGGATRVFLGGHYVDTHASATVTRFADDGEATP